MARHLREVLTPIIGKEAASAIVASYDVIGDIAIIKVPDEAFNFRKKIGDSIMLSNKAIKSVWAQVSPVKGSYRLRDLLNIAGENRSTTIHKESGCLFHVDVRGAYFSPRLSHERERISNVVMENERVFNMFAGVGTFSIIIARRVQGTTVFSSEINEAAYKDMLVNIGLNRLRGKVIPLNEDARDVASRLINQVDRVLMPLPENAMDYYEDAIKTLNGQGWIHLYIHEKREKDVNYFSLMKEKLRPYGGNLKRCGVVREVGPGRVQLVCDIHFNANDDKHGPN